MINVSSNRSDLQQHLNEHQPPQLSYVSDLKSHSLNSSVIFGQAPMFVNLLFNKQMQIDGRNVEKSVHQSENQFIRGEEDKYQILQLPQLKLIKKFAKSLMQNAYIYRESLLNTFQKKMLAEKFTEFENIQNQTNEKYFQLQQLVWDALIFVIEILMIFWLPLKIGFKLLSNQTFVGIILFVLTINFLKTIENNFSKKLLKIPESIWIDILSISSFCAIEFLDIEPFDSIALIILILVNLQKIETTINVWKDYLPFDIRSYALIFKLLFLIHACGCLLHFIGIYETSSWITETDFEEKSIFTLYCACLFWSTATLLNIGQSHIQLKTEPELIYSSVLMLLSCWILSNILVNTLNTHHSQIKQEDHIQQVYCYFRKNIGLINQFFKNQNISIKTMAKIRKYIRNQNRDKMVMKDIENIIQTLSSNLKNELMFQIRVDVLLKCKCLRMFSTHTVQKLTNIMESNYYNKDEIISQTDHSLYIIDSGKIEIIECDKVIVTLTTQDTFGEQCFFAGSTIKTAFKIIECAKIWKIKQDDFLQLIKKYQLDYERYMYIKETLKNGDFSIINLYCYSCNSTNHLVESCPIITFKPNRVKIIKAETLGEQYRQSFQRDQKINHKLNNKVFQRLNENNESLYRFQLQQRMLSEDQMSNGENEIIDSSQDLNQTSEKMLANISNNRAENQRERTLTSISKQKYFSENQAIIFEQKLKPEENQSIEQRGLQITYLKRDSQLVSPYRISCLLEAKKKQTPSIIDQPSQCEVLTEEPIPPIKQVTNLTEILHNKKKKINQRPQQKGVRNNSQIYRTSKDSISLSNRLSLDELSGPFQVMGKNISNTQINSPSKRGFSSKLSMIPERTANTDKILTCWIPSPQSQNLRFNPQPNFVDLSTFKTYGTGYTEFDNLHLYTIYFPEYNVQNVVQRVNYHLRKKNEYLKVISLDQ